MHSIWIENRNTGYSNVKVASDVIDFSTAYLFASRLAEIQNSDFCVQVRQGDNIAISIEGVGKPKTEEELPTFWEKLLMLKW